MVRTFYNMARPRVSIGMPVHNGEAYLDTALRSIRAQTYEDFELLVSDNGSTDGTAEIVRKHARDDPRIRFVQQAQNLGAVPNFNYVCRHAEGEYFKWAAHDDVLHPEFLQACVAALDDRPDATVAFPRAKVIDAQGQPVERYEVHLGTDSPYARERFRDILLSWHRCYEIFGLIRARALRSTELLRSFWGADRTLLQELALQGPFVEIPRELFYPRRHDEQSVLKMRGKVVERTYWSDMRMNGKIVLPMWRVVGGNLRAIQRAGVGPTDKAQLCGYVGQWAGRHWKVLARDVARAGRQLARRARL